MASLGSISPEKQVNRQAVDAFIRKFLADPLVQTPDLLAFHYQIISCFHYIENACKIKDKIILLLYTQSCLRVSPLEQAVAGIARKGCNLSEISIQCGLKAQLLFTYYEKSNNMAGNRRQLPT